MEEKEKRKNGRSMRNRNREIEKKKSLLEDRKLRVREAIKQGVVISRDLANIAGIKLHDLKNIFTNDRELYAEYCVAKKTIENLAADNIYKIVEDESHPKNYDASKFIIQNFRTEIDDILDGKNGEMLDIEIGGNSDGGGITLKFGNSKDEKDE